MLDKNHEYCVMLPVGQKITAVAWYDYCCGCLENENEGDVEPIIFFPLDLCG